MVSWHIISTIYKRPVNWNWIIQMKLSSSKTPLFMIGPFCPPYSICLNTGFWRWIFYGNVAFSIIVLSTKKKILLFCKKGFRFLENLFQSQNIENRQISSDLTWKYADIFNGGLFWKSPTPVFRGAYFHSVGFLSVFNVIVSQRFLMFLLLSLSTYLSAEICWLWKLVLFLLQQN